MRARLAHLAVAIALAVPAAAAAQPSGEIRHKVRADDTLSLLAAEYYGDRNHKIFIMVANGMTHERPLKKNERIKIPVTRRITPAAGDTLEILAEKYLGDRRRARFLAMFNGLEEDASVAAGQVLQIPFHVVHEAQAKEKIRDISLAYFRDTKQAQLIQEYNFRETSTLEPGDKIVVPIYHVDVSPQKLPPVDAESRARSEKRQQMMDRARRAMVTARADWKNGNFAALKRALTTIDIDYLDTELAVEVGVLLGATYVAFDDVDSALAAFVKVLDRQPGHELDPYRFSPKVQRVWKRAGRD